MQSSCLYPVCPSVSGSRSAVYASFTSRFPPNWPVFTPAEKVFPLFHLSASLRLIYILFILQLADWLGFYVESLELDVWLSSSVQSITRDPISQRWSVAVHKQGGGEIRVLHPTHIVCATGMFSSPKIPDIPGKVIHQRRPINLTKYVIRTSSEEPYFTPPSFIHHWTIRRGQGHL